MSKPKQTEKPQSPTETLRKRYEQGLSGLQQEKANLQQRMTQIDAGVEQYRGALTALDQVEAAMKPAPEAETAPAAPAQEAEKSDAAPEAPAPKLEAVEGGKE